MGGGRGVCVCAGVYVYRYMYVCVYVYVHSHTVHVLGNLCEDVHVIMHVHVPIAPWFVPNAGDVIVMSLFLFPCTYAHTHRKWFFPRNMTSSIER